MDRSAMPHGDSWSSQQLDLFADCSYSSLRRVRCELVDGTLVLRGRVPSYYLKQVALAVARRFSESTPIKDGVEVGEEPRGLPSYVDLED
jgi:hypothetical protein